MDIDKGFRNFNHKIINHKSLDSIVLIIINFNSDKTRIVQYLKKNRSDDKRSRNKEITISNIVITR